MSIANKNSILNSDIKLKKSLGQNFLKEKNIVSKIVKTANVSNDTTVIEIGPGIGALTEQLLEISNNVIAIEIDQRLIGILEENFRDNNNFELINQDFLEIDVEKLKKSIINNKAKVVANLPYYITTPIIFKILLEMEFVDEIYIMVQKEVAERICAVPKTKKYNSLSIFCQTLSDVKLEFIVKKEVFLPVPKIDSAIISLKKKPIKINIKEFEQFVQKCFVQKRKTIINNLSQSYNIPKDEIISFLETQGYTKNTRSEEIGVTEFFDLYNAFIKEYN